MDLQQIQLSLHVLTQKEQKCFLVPIQDWAFIKDGIQNIQERPNWFTNVGLWLLGIFSSSLLTAIFGDFRTDTKKVVCWAIVAISLICGLILIIAGQQKKSLAESVLKQMDLIESRHELEEQNTVSKLVASNKEVK